MAAQQRKRENLQDLVAEEFREKVAVVPINSLRLCITAFGLLSCGFALVISPVFPEKVATTIGVILIIAGFTVGKFTNRKEYKLLKEIESEQK